MMLALGMFVFMRQTLPHQTMQRESDYRWPSNSRIGKRDAYQFLGVGEENMTLAGVLYPELTGGKLTMTTLRLMAEEGRAVAVAGWHRHDLRHVCHQQGE